MRPLEWPENISEELKDALMDWEHAWFDAEDDEVDALIEVRNQILKDHGAI